MVNGLLLLNLQLYIQQHQEQPGVALLGLSYINFNCFLKLYVKKINAKLSHHKKMLFPYGLHMEKLQVKNTQKKGKVWDADI